MARRTYDDATKAAALELYTTHGPTAVQDQLGIPKATVAGWAASNSVRTVRNETTAAATEAIAADRALKREALREAMLDRALDLIGRMDEEHIDFRGKDAKRVIFPKPSASGCQAYATAAAILLDKVRLELGEATGRHEVHHHEHDPIDDEIEALAAELEARAPA